MSENSGASAPSAPVAAESTSSAAEQSQQVQPGQEGAPANKAEAQDAVEAAIEAGDTKEAQRLIKKYDLKIRGKTVSREVDLSDDNFVRNQLQLAEVAKIEMQKSAELEKRYKSELQRLQQDPWTVLQELGFDPDQLAEGRLEQTLNRMKMTPEQIAAEKRDRELEEARKERDLLKKEKEDYEMQTLRQQEGQKLRQEIDGALSNSKVLPKNDKSVRRIADAMSWAMNELKRDDITADQVLAFVEEDYRREISSLMDDSPEEVLEQLIGQKNLERMRKKRLAAKKSSLVDSNPAPLAEIKPTAQSLGSKESKPKEKIPARDFFKNIDKYVKS